MYFSKAIWHFLLLLFLTKFLLFLFRQLPSLLGRIVLALQLKLGMFNGHHVSPEHSTVEYLQSQIYRFRLHNNNHQQQLQHGILLEMITMLLLLCGSVVEWLGSQTCDQLFTGLNPGIRAAECNPGQVVYTHVPLSTNGIIWYRPMGGDARCLGR